MITYIFRDEAWTSHTEFYQYSKGMKIIYNKTIHTFEELSFRGKPVEDYDEITFAIQNYHFQNFDAFFGIPLETIKQNRKPRMVATSVQNIVEEYLSCHPDLDARVEGRIIIKS